MQSVHSPHIRTASLTQSELSEQVDRRLRIYRNVFPADLNMSARLDLPPWPLPFLCGWGQSLTAEWVRAPHPHAEQDRHNRVGAVERPED